MRNRKEVRNEVDWLLLRIMATVMGQANTTLLLTRKNAMAAENV